MRTISVCLLLILSVPALAKKQPGDDRRNEFLLNFQKMMERDSQTAVPMMAGKNHEILQIWLPQAPVPYMYEFEKNYVEPLKAGYKAKMKELGFSLIELKTDTISASFPKGVWDIPLE